MAQTYDGVDVKPSPVSRSSSDEKLAKRDSGEKGVTILDSAPPAPEGTLRRDLNSRQISMCVCQRLSVLIAQDRHRRCDRHWCVA